MPVTLDDAVAGMENLRTDFQAKADLIAGAAQAATDTNTAKTAAEADAVSTAASKALVDADTAALAAVVANIRNGVSDNADLWREESTILRLTENQAAVQSGGDLTLPDGWNASSANIQFEKLFDYKAGSPTDQDALGGNQVEFDAFFADLGIAPPGNGYGSFRAIKVTWTAAAGANFFQHLNHKGTAMVRAAYMRRISGSVAGSFWSGTYDVDLPLNTWKLAGLNLPRSNGYQHSHIQTTSAAGELHIFLPAIATGSIDFDVEPWRWWYSPRINDVNYS